MEEKETPEEPEPHFAPRKTGHENRSHVSPSCH